MSTNPSTLLAALAVEFGNDNRQTSANLCQLAAKMAKQDGERIDYTAATYLQSAFRATLYETTDAFVSNMANGMTPSAADTNRAIADARLVNAWEAATAALKGRA